MKRFLLLVVIAMMVVGLMAGTALANPSDNPTNAAVLGAERGERNRAGGDREKGIFGPGEDGQAAFVKAEQPYGQWLQTWFEAEGHH